jgi:hypothetical protein
MTFLIFHGMALYLNISSDEVIVFHTTATAAGMLTTISALTVSTIFAFLHKANDES